MILHVSLAEAVNGQFSYDFEYSGSMDWSSIREFVAQQLDVGLAFFDNYQYNSYTNTVLANAVYGN